MLTEKYKALQDLDHITSPEEIMWLSAIWHSYYLAVRGDKREIKYLTEEIEPQRIGSFHWICSALNICPDTLRTKFIREWGQLVTNKLQRKGIRTIRENGTGGLGNGFKLRQGVW